MENDRESLMNKNIVTISHFSPAHFLPAFGSALPSPMAASPAPSFSSADGQLPAVRQESCRTKVAELAGRPEPSGQWASASADPGRCHQCRTLLRKLKIFCYILGIDFSHFTIFV
jgi:hypothetical protein